MQTPDMVWNKDGWMMNGVARCIKSKCSPEEAAKELGVDKSLVLEYYQKYMVKHSVPAVHLEYGCVKVFYHEGWKSFFIFDVDNKLLGADNVGQENWKCPPALDI